MSKTSRWLIPVLCALVAIAVATGWLHRKWQDRPPVSALAWPLAEATGQMLYPLRWGPPEWAMLGAGILNTLAYSGYVWLIERAGSVFASLIAYLVTGFGVLWSKLLLGESYAPLVWVAFVVMLAGIALIQPLGAPAKKA
jgi:drug/metabolite transporter (DMT)-like permease